MDIPSQDELGAWLEYISIFLDSYLPPHNKKWSELMRSSYEVAMIGPNNGDLFSVGGKIFYKIAKNHHLVDGNKRSAVICTYLFFYKNQIVLTLPADQMYDLAKTVVESSTTSEEWAKRLAVLFNKFSQPASERPTWLR